MKTILHIPSSTFIGKFYSKKEAHKFILQWNRYLKLLHYVFTRESLAIMATDINNKYIYSFKRPTRKWQTANYFWSSGRCGIAKHFNQQKICSKLDISSAAGKGSKYLHITASLYPEMDVYKLNKKEFEIVSLDKLSI